MKKHIKFIALSLAIIILGGVSAMAADKSLTNRNEALVLDYINNQMIETYSEYYTIPSIFSKIINREVSENGDICLTVGADFTRVLLAESASDMPYIKGLEAGAMMLTDAMEIAAAEAYISVRTTDLEENYIGKPQDTYVEFRVVLPAAALFTKAASAYSALNAEICVNGMLGDAPVEALTPRSEQESYQSGKADINTVAANSQTVAANNQRDALGISPSALEGAKNLDRIKARDYARKWCCDSGKAVEHGCHNKDKYGFIDQEDCANFVSQCLVDGGLETDDTWDYSLSNSTWTGAISLPKYLVEQEWYYPASYAETKAFAGSIISWVNSSGVGTGHIGIVDQNDSQTMTFCAHTYCRKSCPWTGEPVNFYIPRWDSYANAWTPQP